MKDSMEFKSFDFYSKEQETKLHTLVNQFEVESLPLRQLGTNLREEPSITIPA